jgi:maltose alpha-D-glucosyltransferase/alpha-amylase
VPPPTAPSGPRDGPCYFDDRGCGNAGPFLAAYHDALAAIGEPGHIVLPTANHDFARLCAGPRTPGQLPPAFAFLLTFPTLPAIYYGDEIGMRHLPGLPDTEGSVMASGYNRAGSRTPMNGSQAPARDFRLPRPQSSTCRSTRTRSAPPSPPSAPTATRSCTPSGT